MRVVEIGRHHELASATVPGALGQALRASSTRAETDLGLDQAELGRLGGKQYVAAERQLECRRQCQRVSGEDGRAGQLLNILDHRQKLAEEHSGLGRIHAVEDVHVHPGGDDLALRAEEKPSRRVSGQLARQPSERLDHLAVKEIERRAVEGEHGERAISFESRGSPLHAENNTHLRRDRAGV